MTTWSSNQGIDVHVRDAAANEIPTDDCYIGGDAIDVKGSFSQIYTSCTYKTSHYRLAVKSVNDNFISFSTDSQFYKAIGFGIGYAGGGGILIPSTDIHISRQYLGQNGSSLKVFKNATTHIQKNEVLQQYEWNPSAPDFELRDANGEYIRTMALGYSANGKWVAAEIVNVGIVLINLESNVARLVSGAYSLGADPNLQLHVSDDGSRVLMAGTYAKLMVVDVYDDCGVSVSMIDANFSPSDITCPREQFDDIIRQNIPVSNTYLYHAKFENSAKSITGYVLTYGGEGKEYKKITLSLAGSVHPGINYLALGDSYSSGEGDTEKDQDGKKFYRANTDVNGDTDNPREKCHVSTRSYPYVLASNMSLGLPLAMASTKWQTVACSAASVWDMKAQGSTAYLGQSDRLKNHNSSNLKANALNEFIPGRQKQVEFVKKYKPSAITLTAGGNDIGFGEKMKACALSVTTCFEASDEGKKRLSRQISDQYDNLKSLYTELYESSDRTSRVYAISYPQFINGDKNANCQDKNLFNLDGSERQMIGESITYMNNTIKHAATASGIKYIDIQEILSGHKLCDAGKKYVTGITNVLGLNGNEITESFHPNAKGHNEMALGIISRTNGESLQTYKWCENSNTNCANPAASKATIETPAYFTEKENQRKVEYRDFTNKEVANGASLPVSVAPYMFAPNTSVQAFLQSTDLVLPSIDVGIKGAINTIIQLPTTITPGLHTVLLEGNSYSGEPIGFEQIVLVKSSNPLDVDGDGISDTVDKCLYITAINIDQDMDGIDDACDPYIDDAPVVTPSPSPSASPSPSTTPTPGNGAGSTNPFELLIRVIKKIVIVIVKIVIFFAQLFRLF